MPRRFIAGKIGTAINKTTGTVLVVLTPFSHSDIRTRRKIDTTPTKKTPLYPCRLSSRLSLVLLALGLALHLLQAVHRRFHRLAEQLHCLGHVALLNDRGDLGRSELRAQQTVMLLGVRQRIASVARMRSRASVVCMGAPG